MRAVFNVTFDVHKVEVQNDYQVVSWCALSRALCLLVQPGLSESGRHGPCRTAGFPSCSSSAGACSLMGPPGSLRPCPLCRWTMDLQPKLGLRRPHIVVTGRSFYGWDALDGRLNFQARPTWLSAALRQGMDPRVHWTRQAYAPGCMPGTHGWPPWPAAWLPCCGAQP